MVKRLLRAEYISVDCSYSFQTLKSFTVSFTLYQLFVVRLIKVLRVGLSLLNSTPSAKKYILT